MRAISNPASYSNDTITICGLLDIVLQDGTIIKLTNHDKDVGDYISTLGLDLSNVTLQLGGSGQTNTVDMLPGPQFTFAQIEGGLLDDAKVVVSLIDWATGGDPLIIFTGTCDQATYGNAAVITLSLNTPMSKSRPLCATIMSQLCRADFGDADCGVSLDGLIDGPHVFAPIDLQSFVMTPDEQTPDNFYNNGTCYFASGVLKGQGYEILSTSANDQSTTDRETITLKVPMATMPAKGDALVLYPGCDKLINSGCTFWNNTANFQGEPFIASQDNVLPATDDSSDDNPGGGGDGDPTNPGSTIPVGMNDPENYAISQWLQVAFGVNFTFQAGAGNGRIEEGFKRVTPPPPAPDGYWWVYWQNTFIGSDAYNALYDAVGGADKVENNDGRLVPKSADAVAALQAAGYDPNVNWCASVLYFNGTNDTNTIVNDMLHGNAGQYTTPAPSLINLRQGRESLADYSVAVI